MRRWKHEVYFNSQPHEEADEKLMRRWKHEVYFNSQPHEEADYETLIYNLCSGISTHSLTKRLTRCVFLGEPKETHFNSQPHEEADLNNFPMILDDSNFNSQPHEEADYKRCLPAA